MVKDVASFNTGLRERSEGYWKVHIVLTVAVTLQEGR